MKQTRWWKYVTETIQGRTFKEAAKIAGFDQSAFTRWKDGAAAKPEFVVKFARAYNRNVLEALVEAEFITEQEAGLQKVNVPDIRSALRLAPEEWLADEVLKRMRAAAKPDEFAPPLDELVERKQHKANELKPETKPDDPWAAAATVSGKSSWRGDEMVADDSEEEGFLGDDNYSDGP
jgi:hypothetical protein